MLKFHPNKCKVLQIGKPRPEKYQYYMEEASTGIKHILEYSDSEKDIGVHTDPNLSFDVHINDKVNKANKVMGLIRRTFLYMDSKMFLSLYKSLVRPILEYASVCWSPFLKRQIEQLEKVQRRATKLVPGFKNLEYVDRLKKLGLPTLKFRRTRGSMIELYKLTHNKYEDFIYKELFQVAKRPTNRGHDYKLFQKGGKSLLRKNFFTLKAVAILEQVTK